MVVILVVCFFVPPPYSIDCRSQCRFVCVSYRLSSLFSSLYIQSLYLMSFSLSLSHRHPSIVSCRTPLSQSCTSSNELYSPDAFF